MSRRTIAQLTADNTNLSTLVTSGARVSKSDHQAMNQNIIDSFSMGIFDIKNYGASPTGSVSDDSTAGIQAAVNAAMSQGGGVIFIPPGRFRTTSTILGKSAPDNLYFLGCGEASQICPDGNFGDVIDLVPTVPRDNLHPVYGVKFDKIFFNPLNNRTTGWIINTKYTHAARVMDCRIGTLQWQGSSSFPIYAYQGVNFDIQTSALFFASQVHAKKTCLRWSGDFTRFTGQLGHGFWGGFCLGGCDIWGDKWNGGGSSYYPDSAGILLEGTGGFQLNQANISFFENGVYCLGNTRELFLEDAFMGDDCGGAGIRVEGTCNIITFDNVWVGGSNRAGMAPTPGVYIADSMVPTWNPPGITDTRIQITGGTVYGCGGDGIYVGAGIVNITGVQSYANTGNQLVLGPNVKKASIVGGWIPGFVNNSAPAITPKIRGVIDLADAG